MDQDPLHRTRAVVLLSGGLDSATCLAIAHEARHECHALCIDYGQRHSIELDAARRVAAHLGAESFRTVKIDLGTFGGSALTADIDVPKSDEPFSSCGAEDGIPVTYVPARNTVFLSCALALAEVLDATRIYIGANSIDYSGYPDCRPAFIIAFQKLADVATKAGVEGHAPRIEAPLLQMTKADIIRKGLGLGVDFAITHSCYDPHPDASPCRRCESCRIRAAAFAEVGVPDPRRISKRETRE